MILINLEPIIAWFYFWFIYWIFGLIISFYCNYYNISKITRLKDVCINLIFNMFNTFISLNILLNIQFDIFSYWNIYYKFLFCIFITEFWFYHTHIMLHQKDMYIKFHKKHHEFKHPYALTAIYCTAYECIVCNVTAVCIGPILTGLKGYYLYIWTILVTLNTLIGHSGITIKLGKYYLYPNMHDIHHSDFLYNYGTLNLLDSMYSTIKNRVN